jgi:hypothetical protein
MFNDAEKIEETLKNITNDINSSAYSFKRYHHDMTRYEYLIEQKADLDSIYSKSLKRINYLSNFYLSFIFGENKEAEMLNIPQWNESWVVLNEENKKDRKIFEMEKMVISTVNRDAHISNIDACQESLTLLDKKYLMSIKKHEGEHYFTPWISNIENSIDKNLEVKKSAIDRSEKLQNSLGNAAIEASENQCYTASNLQEAITCESNPRAER